MTDPVRRRLILAAAGALALPAQAARAAAPRALTPACNDETPTPEQTAGPFYTPDAPEKRDFRADTGEGSPVRLICGVLDRNCAPLTDAIVDLWHADAVGRYDNRGYVLRGFQRAGGDGGVMFETIAPGRYPGRTPHYHLRVFRAGRLRLTTQLYFPGLAANLRDGIYDPALDMAIDRDGDILEARYSLVIDTDA